MKQYRIRFYARVGVVATLSAIGMVALSGEPAEGANFIAVVAAQVGVAAACWGIAWRLAKRWQLTRVLRLMQTMEQGVKTMEQGVRMKDRTAC